MSCTPCFIPRSIIHTIGPVGPTGVTGITGPTGSTANLTFPYMLALYSSQVPIDSVRQVANPGFTLISGPLTSQFNPGNGVYQFGTNGIYAISVMVSFPSSPVGEYEVIATPTSALGVVPFGAYTSLNPNPLFSNRPTTAYLTATAVIPAAAGDSISFQIYRNSVSPTETTVNIEIIIVRIGPF